MTPDDPLLAKINREAAAVFSQGSTMKIEAVLPSTDTNPREFIQRQFITAILWEKFFANATAFDKNTKLDVVPLWLVEGLREWINEDPEHTRESIVRRAVKNQTAPTLADVTGWHELSDDKLLGIWQRAFSYYLVDMLVQQGGPRDDFQQWLDGFAGSSRSQFHFPTETAWQRELGDAAEKKSTTSFIPGTKRRVNCPQTRRLPSPRRRMPRSRIARSTRLPRCRTRRSWPKPCRSGS